MWIAAAWLACPLASAQNEVDETEAERATALPADLLDRGTPRRSIRGYLRATAARDYERAAEYLDLRNLPRGLGEADGPRLAEDLDIVLQRHIWIDLESLSDDIEGWSGDGLPSYRDRFGVLDTNRGEALLLMQQIPGENDSEIWKISNATVATIPDLYAELGYSRWVENMRRTLPDIQFLGIELFKWVIAIAAALIVYGAGWALCIASVRLFGSRHSVRSVRVKRFLTRPVLAFAAIVTMSWVGADLGISFVAQEGLGRYKLFTTATTLWLLLASVGLARDLYQQRLREQSRDSSEIVLKPLATAVQIIIAVAVLLMWLDNIGFSVTTLLAGLGVGGLAVALVLQKPLEDIFGAISIYTQRPIRIGDFCRVGETMGTVEQISLRSTRIRTLENTLVAIPNASVANASIDNFSMRQKIWYHPVLRLRYDTSPEQLRQLLKKIQAVLNEQAKVIPENATVRVLGFGEYAIEVGVRAYIATTTFMEFLEVGEELNLAIMDIVAETGTAFAMPPDWQMAIAAP